MKKSIALSTAFLLLAFVSFAQTTSFGIKAAVTTNYLTFKLDDGDDDQRLIGNNTGFYVGGVANIQFSDRFAIQPNLLFALKGGAIEELKVNTFHIDVPINFLYTNEGFFIGGGPNFSYAISGTGKVEDEKIDIFDQDEAEGYTLKQFEIGANFLIGYTCPNGITLSASFTPGLNNIYEGAEGDDSDIVGHNKSFGFSIGYMFGRKAKK